MSYDLKMSKLPPETDLEMFLEAHETDSDLLNIPELTEAERSRFRAIALKIASHGLGFRLFEGDRCYLDLENLTDGIQISFRTNAIFFMLPYWYKGEQAQTIFKKIWKYVAIIQDETGYIAYDQQLGRVLDLATDFDDVVRIYLWTIGQMDAIMPPKPLPAD
jgi:hypothetical protein